MNLPTLPRKALRLRGAIVATSALLFASLGCYEIPPSLPDGYAGSAASEGFSEPPPAYEPDPFHPLNRWFQRAFARRDPSGRLSPVSGAEILPDYERLGPVDCAEMIALLDAGLGTYPDPSIGPRGLGRAGATAAIFRADVLEFALHLSDAARGSPAPQDGDLATLVDRLLDAASTYRGAATGDIVSEESLPAGAEPPPLRETSWVEADLPLVPGVGPAVEDFRWTRLLLGGEPEGPQRAVLLRLRIALDGSGRARLLPLANECWDIREGEPPTLWVFDRGLWAEGADPWLRAGGGPGSISIQDFLSAVSARGDDGQAGLFPFTPILDSARRRKPREAAEAILAGL